MKHAMKQAAIAYGYKAARKGAHLAKVAAIHIYTHAEASGWTVKGVAFVVSLAMIFFSVLGLINIFRAVIHPYYYLLDVYNILFVMEGPSELQCAYCGAWSRAQKCIFGWAAFLASRTGRALFYFFIGTLNLFMLPEDWFWKSVYFGIGSALSFVGLLSLLDRYGCTALCCPECHGHVEQAQQSHRDSYGSNEPSDNETDEESPPRQQHADSSRMQKVQEMEKLLDADFGRGSLYRH